MQQSYRSTGLLVACLAGVWSCGGGGAPGTPTAPIQSASTEQGHLLLYPMSDAADLLGRPVHPTGDGAWTIGDHRRAGCEVNVRERTARFQTRRRVNLHALASVSAGFARFMDLEASHGTAVESDVEVDNTAVLEADMRGACGERVVDRVFVGRGRRTLLRSGRSAVQGSGSVGAAPVGGGYESSSEVIDGIQWADDQAYAFSFRAAAANDALELSVELAPQVADGDPIIVHFRTNRAAYLVVYFLEASGRGSTLWPSEDEPEPRVQPGSPLRMPSAKEEGAGVRLRAALRDKHKRSRETLVVYAFSEVEDFRQLRPLPGSETESGADYAATLTGKLQELPMSRWARTVIGYTIEPKTRRP